MITTTNVLLSWDSLGFRLLVFAGVAAPWVFQVRLGGASWAEAVRMELGGAMPWAFLAPLVLSLDRRIRARQKGVAYWLGGHALGMILLFIPYWMIQRVISLTIASWASGWGVAQLSVLLPTPRNLLGNFLSVPFIYFLILLGAEAMRHAQARRDEEVQAERLAAQLSDARLALLQRQLHPHFLFNALQAVSTLLHRDPPTADRLLVRLSALLRAMLDEASGQTLDLGTELDLARQFAEIEQVRFGDRLCVQWMVDPSLLETRVPSLVVLPLVENAIRHGLSRKMGVGHLTVRAARHATALVLTVEDDGQGATEPLRHGVGLANTRARLHAMYGAEASLETSTSPKGGFRASVRVPLEERPT
jgi:hypothetical protein